MRYLKAAIYLIGIYLAVSSSGNIVRYYKNALALIETQSNLIAIYESKAHTQPSESTTKSIEEVKSIIAFKSNPENYSGVQPTIMWQVFMLVVGMLLTIPGAGLFNHGEKKSNEKKGHKHA